MRFWLGVLLKGYVVIGSNNGVVGGRSVRFVVDNVGVVERVRFDKVVVLVGGRLVNGISRGIVRDIIVVRDVVSDDGLDVVVGESVSGEC